MMMNKKPHKHANAIKAWADGYKLLYSLNKDNNIWRTASTPQWHQDREYIINDALVEFRKAEIEGKRIKFSPHNSDKEASWHEVSLKDTPATESYEGFYKIEEKEINLLVRIKENNYVYILTLDEDDFNKEDEGFTDFLVICLEEKYDISIKKQGIDVILRYQELIL